MENRLHNIDEKVIKYFRIRFLLRTEFITYFLIVPLLFVYVWTNLGINQEELILLLKCTAVALLISMPTTLINDLIVLSPVSKYFSKIIKGETVTDKEHNAAQKRFFMLPFVHSFGSLFRWIFGLLLCFVPFTLLTNLNSVQIFNMWVVLFIIPPFGMLFYFFLTEVFIQNILNRKVFADIALDQRNLKINFVTRIWISGIIMVLIPVIAITGFFMRTINNFDGIVISYSQLAAIIIFGLAVAFTSIYFLMKSIKFKINSIINLLTKIGHGDLTAPKDTMAVMDELTRINQAIHTMKINITEMINDIYQISNQLDDSVKEISIHHTKSPRIWFQVTGR